MKKTVSSFLSIVLFLFFLLHAHPVLAHGGEPRIEISAERLIPGSVLDLRGVDFERDAEVALTLVGPQVENEFGVALVDAEGIFQLTISLPADLPEGMYFIRATSTDHVVESPQFAVSGIADSEEGEQRELEEPLLAPMPTVSANAPTPISQLSAPIETLAQPNPWMLVVWIAVGIGIVLMLALVLRRKKS